MSCTKLNKKLKGKDLITIIIFSAIYFILALTCNILGGIHAIIWFFSPAISPLICGIPYMILTSKVKKPFAVIIMGIAVGLLFIASVQSNMHVLVTYIIGAIIAEIIRCSTNYSSFTADTIGFSIFSLGMAASRIPLWINSESFITRIKEFGMPQSYVNIVIKLTATRMLVIMIITTIVCSLIGAFIAKALFIKAGKVA